MVVWKLFQSDSKLAHLLQTIPVAYIPVKIRRLKFSKTKKKLHYLNGVKEKYDWKVLENHWKSRNNDKLSSIEFYIIVKDNDTKIFKFFVKKHSSGIIYWKNSS